MNILIVFFRKIIPSNGGVERVSYLLAEEFIKRGQNVSFLSVGPKECNTDGVDHGIHQYYLEVSESDFETQFAKLLTELKIDRIIFQSNHNSVVNAIQYVPQGVRKYLVLHFAPHAMHKLEKKTMLLTPWKDMAPRQKFLKAVCLICPPAFRLVNNKKNSARYRRITETVDKFIFLSDRYIDRINKLTRGLHQNKLAAINNPNTFEVKDEDNLSKKENIILMVARLSNPQKNVTGFIDVWEKFSKLYPDWKAIVVGDGEHRDIIERYAKKKDVKNFQLAGNQKNMAEYYRKAKILCMTSMAEGWPMVIAEAMAYGCVPVVYHTFDAVYDQVDDGENGYIVRALDISAMVNRLDLLASDEWLRMEMAEAGKKKIKKFTVDKIADEWLNLMKGYPL